METTERSKKLLLLQGVLGISPYSVYKDGHGIQSRSGSIDNLSEIRIFKSGYVLWYPRDTHLDLISMIRQVAGDDGGERAAPKATTSQTRRGRASIMNVETRGGNYQCPVHYPTTSMSARSWAFRDPWLHPAIKRPPNPTQDAADRPSNGILGQSLSLAWTYYWNPPLTLSTGSSVLGAFSEQLTDHFRLRW
jgi:hypothetical protein